MARAGGVTELTDVSKALRRGMSAGPAEAATVGVCVVLPPSRVLRAPPAGMPVMLACRGSRKPGGRRKGIQVGTVRLGQSGWLQSG